MNEFSLRFLSFNSSFLEMIKKNFRKDNKFFQKKIKIMIKKIQFNLRWIFYHTSPKTVIRLSDIGALNYINHGGY